MYVNGGELEGSRLPAELAISKITNDGESKFNAEQHYRIIRCIDDKKSWYRLNEDIFKMAAEVQKINDRCVRRERENARYKTEINKLEYQIQKKVLLARSNEKLKNSQKEREDELSTLLDIKRRSITAIDGQIGKLQRLMAEKDDKFEFIKQQMNIINNRNHERTQKTEPAFKREKKENEYFTAQSKLVLIQNILKHKSNMAMTIKLTDEIKSSKKRFKYSIKNFNRALLQTDHCKCEILLRIDNQYDSEKNKEIIKNMTSNLNLMITIGCICYYRVKAEMTKRKMELWYEEGPSGNPVKFHHPFDRAALTFPKDATFSPSVAISKSRTQYA